MEVFDISVKTGLPYQEIKAKAVRLGINVNAHLPKSHIDSLSTLFKDGFLIIPSKMNSMENDCKCNIPEPVIKNSELGISAYCRKCRKEYVKK